MLSKSRFVCLFIIATVLVALFFKLPEIPQLFGVAPCKNCAAPSPYIPLIGAFYFTLLGALLLLFPAFPSKSMAQAGLLFAIGLGFTFTWLESEICYLCLYSHIAHVLLWTTLLIFVDETVTDLTPLGVKLAIIFTAPIAVVALFSTLNFSLLVYSFAQASPLTTLVKPGDLIPPFELSLTNDISFSHEELKKSEGAVILFTSSNCPYCKEILPQLDILSEDFANVRFIALGRMHSPETTALASHLEWAEDREGKTFSLFGVKGFPTTVILNTDGKVINAFAGAPEGSAELIRRTLQTLPR